MEGFKEDKSKLCQQEWPQAFKSDKIGLLGFSSRGESHKEKNLPGQDANCIKVVNSNHNTVIASIADGVGSAALSHYGSSIATKTATDYLARIFHTSDIRNMADQEIGDHIREAMRKACEEVKKEAELKQQLEYSYQSTLTIAIYDGDNLYFGHIGDDGIVALTKKGELQLITERHKGEEASSVYPLQAGENKYQVRKLTDVDGFVMATDGVLDAFVKNEYEGNRVYYPFIEPALKGNPGTIRKTQEDFVTSAQDWLEYMNSPTIRKQITDDITFVACVNPERILQNPYKFDDIKWKKDDQTYTSKRNAALYGHNQTQSKNTSSKQQIPISQVGKVTTDVGAEDKSKISRIFDRVKAAAKDINDIIKGD